MTGPFPDPVTWIVDEAADAAGGAAAQGFEVLVAGLTVWMLDAVVWVVAGVFDFFLRATDPNVEAHWFARSGPYATTVDIAGLLLVGFVLIGITQGVLAGDVGGILRRVSFELPMAVLGMVGLVTMTQMLIRVTDELSRGLLSKFGDDVDRFTASVASVARVTGAPTGSFVVFLVALICVIAGVVLVAELVVRSALIYVVVALAPLVFAAQLWPALRGAGRKMLELLMALIVSKLVVAVALAVAAAAAGGIGAGGEVSALAQTELGVHEAGGSITESVGILLAATAAFGVAAFSPLLVTRLIPVTEAAIVASGVRGGPMRAGQQAMSLNSYAHRGSHSRLTAVASGPPAGAPSSGAAGGGAIAIGTIAAGPVTKAVGDGARAATAIADRGAAPGTSERRTGGGRPDPGTTRRAPGSSEGNDGRRA